MTTKTSWTIETALEHLLELRASDTLRNEQRFEASQRATDAALAAADRAVQKAEMAAEKRFEGVNEFRNTLADQQRNLIPRSEVDVLMRGMTEKIDMLAGALTNKIDAMEKQVEHLVSERAGVLGGWGYAVGVLGVVVAVASLVAAWMK